MFFPVFLSFLFSFVSVSFVPFFSLVFHLLFILSSNHVEWVGWLGIHLKAACRAYPLYFFHLVVGHGYGLCRVFGYLGMRERRDTATRLGEEEDV